jgi:hypothetical protein
MLARLVKQVLKKSYGTRTQLENTSAHCGDTSTTKI